MRARVSRDRRQTSWNGSIERDAIGEPPLVPGPVNTDVLRTRFHAERVEQSMIVVRIAVEFVNGDVDLVGALDEIERVDGEEGLCVTQDAHRLQVLDIRVRAVTADAFGVEDSDSDDEVLIFHWRSKPHSNRQGFAAVKHVARLLVRTKQLDLGDLDLAR